MSFEVKILEKGVQTVELDHLISEGQLRRDKLLYQDCLGDPYRLWDLLQNFQSDLKTEYFALFEGKQIAGCSARIEHSSGECFIGYRSFLDTDLFISPRVSHPSAVKFLLKQKYAQVLSENDPRVFHWGIEHEPKSLNACIRLARKFNIKFDFSFQTDLFHVPTYLTTQGAPGKFILKQLVDLAPSVLEQLDQYRLRQKSREWISFPELANNFIQNLAKFEKESWVLFHPNLSCGLVLTSLRSARRWKTTGQRQIELERLRRARGYSHLNEVEITFLQAGAPWGELSDIEELLKAAADCSFRLGFDYLVFRDLPKPQIFEQVFQFQRRVFFISFQDSGFHKKLLSVKPKFRIETFFV